MFVVISFTITDDPSNLQLDIVHKRRYLLFELWIHMKILGNFASLHKLQISLLLTMLYDIIRILVWEKKKIKISMHMKCVKINSFNILLHTITITCNHIARKSEYYSLLLNAKKKKTNMRNNFFAAHPPRISFVFI